MGIRQTKSGFTVKGELLGCAYAGIKPEPHTKMAGFQLKAAFLSGFLEKVFKLLMIRLLYPNWFLFLFDVILEIYWKEQDSDVEFSLGCIKLCMQGFH